MLDGSRLVCFHTLDLTLVPGPLLGSDVVNLPASILSGAGQAEASMHSGVTDGGNGCGPPPWQANCKK